MTKAKALYQVKQIIDSLTEEDYNKIPEETIKYIEENMEVDENVKVDPDIPLEEQDIDDYACDFLEQMINQIDSANKVENADINSQSIEELRELVTKLQTENNKIPQIKEFVGQYKEELDKRNKEIEKLKEQNEIMLKSINRLPKLFRRIYFKELGQNLLN